MIEVGTVVEVDPRKKTAKVRFERKSACASCGMCLFKEDAKSIDFNMPNTLEVSEGERVEVEVASNVVLLSALIAYAIPVLLAGLGLLVGLLLKNELLQFALCLIFLVLGYIIIILTDKKFRYTRKLEPKMLSIVKEN